MQRSWYVYDWAASAFSTTVVTVFLGPYLTEVTETAAGADGFVDPFGIPVRAGSFFPYVVSLSVVLQVLLLPLAGALADRARRPVLLLAGAAGAGAVATCGLWFLEGSRYLLGGGLLVLANVAFGVAMVVYNAFLPAIADPDDRDRVSSRGWAAGYLGGGLLLVANLALFTGHEALGIAEATAVRLSLLSAGLWWAVWSLVPLVALRGVRLRGDPARHTGGVGTGFRQLAATVREARRFPVTLTFLVAYLLYNDGVQTVIALASTFGAEELDLPTATLVQAILLVQFVAFAGALLLGALARRFGAQRVVLVSLVVWTLVVGAGLIVERGAAGQFYVLAAAIGLVLGGTQALSRSLFSHLIPPGREAEYFSLYEISERGTSWLGTLVFGLALQATGSYRVAILSLVAFFVAGGLLLTRVDIARGAREAGNPVPHRV